MRGGFATHARQASLRTGGGKPPHSQIGRARRYVFYACGLVSVEAVTGVGLGVQIGSCTLVWACSRYQRASLALCQRRVAIQARIISWLSRNARMLDCGARNVIQRRRPSEEQH